MILDVGFVSWSFRNRFRSLDHFWVALLREMNLRKIYIRDGKWHKFTFLESISSDLYEVDIFHSIFQKRRKISLSKNLEVILQLPIVQNFLPGAFQWMKQWDVKWLQQMRRIWIKSNQFDAIFTAKQNKWQSDVRRMAVHVHNDGKLNSLTDYPRMEYVSHVAEESVRGHPATVSASNAPISGNFLDNDPWYPRVRKNNHCWS